MASYPYQTYSPHCPFLQSFMSQSTLPTWPHSSISTYLPNSQQPVLQYNVYLHMCTYLDNSLGPKLLSGISNCHLENSAMLQKHFGFYFFTVKIPGSQNLITSSAPYKPTLHPNWEKVQETGKDKKLAHYGTDASLKTTVRRETPLACNTDKRKPAAFTSSKSASLPPEVKRIPTSKSEGKDPVWWLYWPIFGMNLMSCLFSLDLAWCVIVVNSTSFILQSHCTVSCRKCSLKLNFCNFEKIFEQKNRVNPWSGE